MLITGQIVSNILLIINLYNVPGFRAPFLQLGGDEMFTALQDDGFKYDCSWASRDYGYLKLGTELPTHNMTLKTT